MEGCTSEIDNSAGAEPEVTNETFSDFIDESDIKLAEDDIEDPQVHVDDDKLSTYDKDYLCNWLKYRGDSLRNTNSAKDCRIK